MGACCACFEGTTKPVGKHGKTARTSSGLSDALTPTSSKKQIVMGKYEMKTGRRDMLGEGSSSICRPGIEVDTGKKVAIKVYKSKSQDRTTLTRFRRQVHVLKQLQEPFVRPPAAELWHPRIEASRPQDLFMELVDYSKDKKGEPGHAEDGKLYIVTEVGDYSLKDFFRDRREKRQALSQQDARSIADALLVVMAGLHAKNLVHLDFKPENILWFSDRFKLIDVDGCVQRDKKISISDSSISFSPCYCAPEWAGLLVDESRSEIRATPSLDAWSVGITLCELVTLDAVLKPMYASFVRTARCGNDQAGFLFMEWLSAVKEPPTPKKQVQAFDPELDDLVRNFLCVADPARRRSCAQCLSHPFVSLAAVPLHDPTVQMKVKRPTEERINDSLIRGTLFKLNADGKASDEKDWLKRDFWLAPSGNLCYFSLKQDRSLVLLDKEALYDVPIDELDMAAVPGGCAKTHVFVVHAASEGGSRTDIYFAAQGGGRTEEETAEYRDRWMHMLRSIADLTSAKTMRFGDKMAEKANEFKMSVRNRRQKVGNDSGFESSFKSKLWKVKVEGNRMNQKSWLEREFAIARNGSLLYWSKREERNLIYYTTEDVSVASIQPLPDETSCKPWSFSIALPEKGGIEFSPGEFAAESEEARDVWFREFQNHGARVVVAL